VRSDSTAARLIIAFSTIMSGSLMPDLYAAPRNNEPKNKHNLTPDEILFMENMTPKQKKKFLKERK